MPPKIITSYWPKPIPNREFDWTAWVDGTEENRWYGYGRTESEAIADLVNNVLQQDATS